LLCRLAVCIVLVQKVSTTFQRKTKASNDLFSKNGGKASPYRESGAWWRASGKVYAAPSLGRRPQYNF